MLPMCSESVRRELIPVLRKYNLPVEYHGDLDTIFSAMRHDKKSGSGRCDRGYGSAYR